MFDFSQVTRFATRLIVSDDIEGDWKEEWTPKLGDEIRSRVPVRTGQLRDSVIETDDGITVGADYAGYVEYGTSDTAPQPFVNPSIDRLLDPATQDAQRRVLARLL